MASVGLRDAFLWHVPTAHCGAHHYEGTRPTAVHLRFRAGNIMCEYDCRCPPALISSFIIPRGRQFLLVGVAVYQTCEPETRSISSSKDDLHRTFQCRDTFLSRQKRLCRSPPDLVLA